MHLCTVYHLYWLLRVSVLWIVQLSFSVENEIKPGQFSFPEPSINLTYQEISNLIKQQGYDVIKNPGGPPLARLGDIVYPASVVLPQLAQTEERGPTSMVKLDYRWIDKSGKAEVFYFFDTKTEVNKEVFEKGVHSWAVSTCITFTKMADGLCSNEVSHPAICVRNEGSCWSVLGNVYSSKTKRPQKMSIGKYCDKYSSAHEMGHALGLEHMMTRTDRDSFITVNHENFKIDFDAKPSMEAAAKKNWLNAKRCNEGQGYQSSTPLPYDYMSLMHYGEAEFGDIDYRPVFVTKEPEYQYMLDYKRSGGYLQSHYDLYLINTVYECSKNWAASCESPPKCENIGYLQKNCKCACAPGYEGARCERKIGPLFPLLDRAKATIEDSKEGSYDFKNKGMHTNNNSYPSNTFVYYQYATLHLKGPDNTTTVSISVFEPIHVLLANMRGYVLRSLLGDIHYTDCYGGMRFYWGDYARGQVRAECASSFITNETKSNALILRAKTNAVGIVIIGRLGQYFNNIDLTKFMVEQLQFHVQFLRRPQSVLKVLHCKNCSTTTTEESVLGAGAAAAAKALDGGGGVLAAAIGVPVVLLAVAAGGALYWWRTKTSLVPETSEDQCAPQSSSQNDSSSSSESNTSDED